MNRQTKIACGVSYSVALLLGSYTASTGDAYFAALGCLYAALGAGFLDQWLTRVFR